MYTFDQALYIEGSTGDSLPAVFKSLDTIGTRFKRGEVCLICAGPGTGKSAFVLSYALQAKIPTLYFSADSNHFTQLSRTASMLTGWPLAQSEQKVKARELPAVARPDHFIRFDFTSSPDLERLALSMRSYAEVYDDYPQLVIVDNITNVWAGGENDENPYAGLEITLEYLHTLTRQTGSCIVGLHHVTGPYNDGDKPIPLSGIKGQIGRLPELILTMHRVPSQYGTDSLNVSTVKNRGGWQDPSGKEFVSLDFDGGTMQIKDQL